MLSRFVTGLLQMNIEDCLGADWHIQGYPGSMRNYKGQPCIVDGLPFDYEEYNTENNKNNERTKGSSSPTEKS